MSCSPPRSLAYSPLSGLDLLRIWFNNSHHIPPRNLIVNCLTCVCLPLWALTCLSILGVVCGIRHTLVLSKAATIRQMFADRISDLTTCLRKYLYLHKNVVHLLS